MNADKATDETDGVWLYSEAMRASRSLEQTHYPGNDVLSSDIF